MSLQIRTLEPPAYGFIKNGTLYIPSHREIFREFFSRLNIFKTKKNWLPFVGWLMTLSLAIPFFVFLIQYFSFPLLILGLVYSMVALGTHGTVWLHRYSTHRAFQIKNPFWRLIIRNLVIKIIPDEVYVVSHHVHHQISEMPGDPYNAHAGWLYCFLADVNHQLIARNLNEKQYDHLKKLMVHTGVHLNSYAGYQKWGSLCHPAFTLLHYALNWTFWYGAFYLLGGHALATAIFGMAVIWAFGVRTFNFDGHGGGVDKRQKGIDFYQGDFSINQKWPGYVAGEWHNNHHLYPNGARSGFLPYQVDLAWLVIRFFYAIGAITSYRDFKEQFYKKYYEPYLAEQKGLLAKPVEELPELA
jgi:fatty-acid desaturase